MEQRTCRACGEPFTPMHHRGRPREKCYRCQPAAQASTKPKISVRCQLCGLAFLTASTHQRFCRVECRSLDAAYASRAKGHRPAHSRPRCLVCNGPVISKRSDASTCSQKCKTRRDALARSAKPGYREYKRAENAKYRGTKLLPRVEQFDCATCGKHCVPGENVAAHARKFCGDPHCKRAWHSPNPDAYRPASSRPAKPQPDPATKLRWVSCRECDAAVVINPRVGRPLGGWVKRRKRGWCCPNCPPGWPDNQTNVWTAGRCRRCGDPFLARNSGNSPTHCTLRCAQRDAKDARRILSPDISRPRRYAVFERDNWCCQLCGKPTRKDQVKLLGGKDYFPQAPTIDHIVPVSKGGTNGESNLQTAHWSCNSAKSDGTFNPAGEQLRLLAA